MTYGESERQVAREREAVIDSQARCIGQQMREIEALTEALRWALDELERHRHEYSHKHDAARAAEYRARLLGQR